MGIDLRRLLVLALAGAAASATLVAPPCASVAWADDEDEDEDEDEDDDEGGGDDEGDEEEEDEDQPPVTAGGLFTLKSYPRRELFRPLTMTEKVTELKAGIGFDISSETAFESVGVLLEARYGLKDHVELQGTFGSAYNFKQLSFAAGIEAALAYDFIDFRAAFSLNRAAVIDPMTLEQGAGDMTPAVDIGFPFRYAARPEIGITALETFFQLLFNDKPTFAPAIGIVTNPIEAVSVIVRAQLIVPKFDFRPENFVVPATAQVIFSPNQRLDLGAEFKFLDLTPPTEERQFYEDRFLTFFATLRM
ncbi:MAG: hypothetical protein KA190_28545 [Kofleriaceae bacterium]|nr:hypothetical protein [Kofleriaceae bacterium]